MPPRGDRRPPIGVGRAVTGLPRNAAASVTTSAEPDRVFETDAPLLVHEHVAGQPRLSSVLPHTSRRVAVGGPSGHPIVFEKSVHRPVIGEFRSGSEIDPVARWSADISDPRSLAMSQVVSQQPTSPVARAAIAHVQRKSASASSRRIGHDRPQGPCRRVGERCRSAPLLLRSPCWVPSPAAGTCSFW